MSVARENPLPDEDPAVDDEGFEFDPASLDDLATLLVDALTIPLAADAEHRELLEAASTAQLASAKLTARH